MECAKFDCYNPKKTVKINPQRITELSLLGIDRFLKYVSQQRPNILETYISNLTKFFGSTIPFSYKNNKGFNGKNIESDSGLLKRHPELIKVAVDLILSFLKLPENYRWATDEITVLRIDLMRANILSFYYRAKMLAETMERDEAVQLLKDYINDAVNNEEIL